MNISFSTKTTNSHTMLGAHYRNCNVFKRTYKHGRYTTLFENRTQLKIGFQISKLNAK
jgi:hypothetical protein